VFAIVAVMGHIFYDKAFYFSRCPKSPEVAEGAESPNDWTSLECIDQLILRWHKEMDVGSG